MTDSLRRFMPAQVTAIQALQVHFVWCLELLWEQLGPRRVSEVEGRHFEGLRQLTGLRRVEFEVVDRHYAKRQKLAFVGLGKFLYESSVKEYLEHLVRSRVGSAVEISIRYIKLVK
jgi:hypothetical protein